MDIVSPDVALGYTYTMEVRAFSLNYPYDAELSRFQRG